MYDVLDFVLDAHGGLERWSAVSALTAKLAVGGPFWGQLGFPDAFPESADDEDGGDLLGARRCPSRAYASWDGVHRRCRHPQRGI
jgi:hypothetical protein